MCTASLACTIGREPESVQAATVRGYERIYNYQPTGYSPSYVQCSEGRETAAANLRKNSNASVGGIVCSVTAEELAALDQREEGYSHITVEIVNFEDGSSLGQAIAYQAPANEDTTLLPRYWDLLLAAEGAFTVSEAFGRAYVAESLLADEQFVSSLYDL